MWYTALLALLVNEIYIARLIRSLHALLGKFSLRPLKGGLKFTFIRCCGKFIEQVAWAKNLLVFTLNSSSHGINLC